MPMKEFIHKEFADKKQTDPFGKYSLTRQVAFAMIALAAGTVLLCLILNTLFLGQYYVWNKSKILSNSYHKINAAAQNGTLDSEEFDIEFERLCVYNNLTIMIINPDQTIVRSSVSDTQTMLKYFSSYFTEEQLKENMARQNLQMMFDIVKKYFEKEYKQMAWSFCVL